MKKPPALNRRSAMAVGVSACTSLLAASRSRAEPANSVLVELFTSQGCSSCPPADKLAGSLSREPGNIVVSFNVDYWDYLGWRDTLAKPEFSQRQYDYATTRGDGQVYTPQMIVNGTGHASSNAVLSLIAQARKAPLPVPIQIEVTAKEITASILDQASDGEATLWLMAIQAEKRQKIARGENAGATVTYHNVVRNLVPAAMWKGGKFTGSWMRDAVMPAGCTSCVAVLQRGRTGTVLGLARS